MSKSIGWGKCYIIAKNIDVKGSKWFLLPTPKEDSTKLNTDKGDKKEATIEGGENEDVKYLKNKHNLAYAIRLNSEREKPYDDDEGVVADHYAVFVQPENKNVPGPWLQKSVVSLEDTFDTTDGGLYAYTHDALKPDNGDKSIEWATIDQDLSLLTDGATLDTEPTFTKIKVRKDTAAQTS